MLTVLYIIVIAYQPVIECNKLSDKIEDNDKALRIIVNSLKEHGNNMSDDKRIEGIELGKEIGEYHRELMAEWNAKCR